MECAGLYIMWMLLAFCTSDEKGIWKNLRILNILNTVL